MMDIFCDASQMTSELKQLEDLRQGVMDEEETSAWAESLGPWMRKPAEGASPGEQNPVTSSIDTPSPPTLDNR